MKGYRPGSSQGGWRACSLVAIILFILTSVLAVPRSASALHLGEERKDTLCGKLVFLENAKTGEKLIGMAPCGQTQPYIFDYRPNELHDYYRLQDVVIRKGTEVRTLNFGTINTYITHFSVSSAIQDCNACKYSAPTWTPRPEQASVNCAGWILQTPAGLIGGSIPDPSQVDKIRYQIGEYSNSPELNQKCGADESCRAQAISIRLGSLLGAIFQHDQLPPAQVIGWLKILLSDPESAKYCQPDLQAVWSLVIGIDQQGYPIQGLQAVTPVTQLCEDFNGKRTGILPDGTLAEEIPGSALVVAGRYKYTLLVAGSAARINLRGNDNGSLQLQMIDFSEAGVLLATFDGLAITDKTRLELDFSSGQPVLKADLQGDGKSQLVQPAKTQSYPILQAWLPTLTPGVLPTLGATETNASMPSATASSAAPTTEPVSSSPIPVTPAPSGTPGSLSAQTPAPTSRFPNPCASTGGLAALALGGWLWSRRY